MIDTKYKVSGEIHPREDRNMTIYEKPWVRGLCFSSGRLDLASVQFDICV